MVEPSNGPAAGFGCYFLLAPTGLLDCIGSMGFTGFLGCTGLLNFTVFWILLLPCLHWLSIFLKYNLNPGTIKIWET